MFNWLKRLLKPNKLLPKDVNDGLMTSMFCTAQIGDKLVVPENCICFLSFKDKIYAEFPAGEHTLEEKTVENLIIKQFGKDFSKNKKLKFDLFFVNMNKFTFSTSQNEKVPVNKRLNKVELKTNFTCQVFEPNKFQQTALGFYGLIRPIDAQHLVQNFVVENLNKFYLKRSFTIPIDCFAESETVKVFLNKKAAKIGLEFVRFDLTIWVKSKNNSVQNTEKSFFCNAENANLSQTSSKSIDNEPKKEYSLNIEPNVHQTQQQETNVCPNCQCKRIANATYCHKCGFKF